MEFGEWLSRPRIASSGASRALARGSGRIRSRPGSGGGRASGARRRSADAGGDHLGARDGAKGRGRGRRGASTPLGAQNHPRVEAAARSDAAREEAETKLAGAIARLAREQRARLAAARGTLPRGRRERAASTTTGAAVRRRRRRRRGQREAKRLEALAATKPEEKPPEGWIPSVGQSVTVIVNGMSGAVKSVSGTSVVVQAGSSLTVDASELEPSAPSRHRAPSKRSVARWDAGGSARGRALGRARGLPEECVAAAGRRVRTRPTRSATTRPSSRIPCAYVKRRGGTVVDAFDGVLTVQAGRNRLKTPVEGGFADRGGAKAKRRVRARAEEEEEQEKGEEGRKRAAEVDEAGESAAGFERRGGHQRPPLAI